MGIHDKIAFLPKGVEQEKQSHHPLNHWCSGLGGILDITLLKKTPSDARSALSTFSVNCQVASVQTPSV